MYNTKTKKQLTLAVIVIVLLMILTGTYAWSSFNQRAFNPAWDIARDRGGRIHVHYNNLNNTSGDDFNKAIFAENFGRQPIFARVRLMEFASINGVEVVGGMDVTDPTTWVPFRFDPTETDGRNVGNVAGEQLRERATLMLGDGAVEAGVNPMVFMPTFNRISLPAAELTAMDIVAFESAGLPAPFNTIHIAQMTEASGAAIDAIATIGDERDRDTWAEPSGNNTGVAAERWASGLQTAVARDPYTEELIPGEGLVVVPNPAAEQNDGSLNFWGLGDSTESLLMRIAEEEDAIGNVEEGDILVERTTHYAQETLAPLSESELNLAVDWAGTSWDDWTGFASATGVDFNDGEFRGVMTFTQWDQLAQPEGEFWIYDDIEDDGWFYWNGFLSPEMTIDDSDPANPVEVFSPAATSRLLEAVTIVAPTGGEGWEYVIEVDSDLFSPTTLLDDQSRVMQSLNHVVDIDGTTGENILSPVRAIFDNAIGDNTGE